MRDGQDPVELTASSRAPNAALAALGRSGVARQRDAAPVLDERTVNEVGVLFQDLALAIAAGMLTALGRLGALVPRRSTYEARPNLRVPVLRPARLTAQRVATTGADQ